MNQTDIAVAFSLSVAWWQWGIVAFAVTNTVLCAFESKPSGVVFSLTLAVAAVLGSWMMALGAISGFVAGSLMKDLRT